MRDYTVVLCRKDYGREKRFYFRKDEKMIIVPNYCDDYAPCEDCEKCAVSALRQKIAEDGG